MINSSILSTVAQRLTGKVALITGGAAGIGAAAAKLFSRHGAKVMVGDIRDDLGCSLVQQIGDTASFIHCDVTNESSVRSAVDSTVSAHGKLDILFSNAGIAGQPSGSIINEGAEAIKHIFNVNVFGAFYCAKHAARVMTLAKTKGNILFTASSAAVSVLEGAPHAYGASKSAVVGLTRSLAVELGKQGIRVNCISPYAVATRMPIELMGLSGREEAEKLFEEAGILKGVVLREEDVAEAALYLTSDDAKYVSGINVVVDGGVDTLILILLSASLLLSKTSLHPYFYSHAISEL